MTRAYLLDTNVVSELKKPRPHGGVVAWLESVDDTQLHLSAVTVGEIQAGIELTREQDPKKAEEIEAWLELVSTTYNHAAHGCKDLSRLGPVDAQKVQHAV